MSTYRLTPSEQVAVVERSPERLVAEVTYAPAGSPPPPHRHPAQDERFEALEGEVTVRVGRETRTLRAGDVLEIPRGTGHRMWNAHPTAPARMRWETSPAGRTEAWWAALDAAVADADGGEPSLRVLAPLLLAYDDVFELAAPRWLDRPALRAIALLGGRGAGRRAPAAGA